MSHLTPPSVPPPVPGAPGEAPPRSWWSRNWKWAVPVGCLAPVVLCGGGLALMFAIIFGAIKTSDAYTQSLQRVSADQRVQQALGTPIEPGMFVSGSINISGNSGDADLSYAVEGSGGSGTVYVIATSQAGAWTFETLEVEVEQTGERIDLLQEP